jgi:hypothetical protein
MFFLIHDPHPSRQTTRSFALSSVRRSPTRPENRWVWRYPRTTEINEASTHKIATHRPSDDSDTAVSDASLIRRRKTASDANRFDDAGTHRLRPSAER